MDIVVDTVDTVDIVDIVVDIVDTVDIVDIVDTVDTLDTVHTVDNSPEEQRYGIAPSTGDAHVAHAHMGDAQMAHVAGLKAPDSGSATKRCKKKLAKTWGWLVLGSKRVVLSIPDWVLDRTGSPSPKNMVLGPKRSLKNNF